MTPVLSRVALALTYRHWRDSLPPAWDRSRAPGHSRILSFPPTPEAQHLPRRQRSLYRQAHGRTRRLLEELPDEWTVTIGGIQRRRLLALTEAMISEAGYRLVERTSGRAALGGDRDKRPLTVGFVQGRFVRVADYEGQTSVRATPPPPAQPSATLPPA